MKKDTTHLQIAKSIEYLNKNYGIRAPIVNMHDIVRSIGGRLSFDNEMRITHRGYVLKRDHLFRMVIPTSLSRVQSNIRVCHLVGYLLLCMGYRTDQRVWKKSSDFSGVYTVSELKLVSDFAHELLMPTDLYIRTADANEREDGSMDVDRVAGVFNVPYEYVIDRGISIGYLERI